MKSFLLGCNLSICLMTNTGEFLWHHKGSQREELMLGFYKSMKIDACYCYKRFEILEHTCVVISCQVRKTKNNSTGITLSKFDFVPYTVIIYSCNVLMLSHLWYPCLKRLAEESNSVIPMVVRTMHFYCCFAILVIVKIWLKKSKNYNPNNKVDETSENMFPIKICIPFIPSHSLFCISTCSGSLNCLNHYLIKPSIILQSNHFFSFYVFLGFLNYKTDNSQTITHSEHFKSQCGEERK